jgi:RNA polymerase subunit RPABC4/transcription elongation factor Spt4
MTEGLLRNSFIVGIRTAQMPLLGSTLSALTLIIVPALFTGSICGGVACLIPEIVEEQIPHQPKALPKITPKKWPGYEKQCLKCGHVMPFDSIYCSFCGATLRRASAPEVKFCRYCGNRIHFIGEFCPDCGREINLISKPKVFVSE